MNRFLKQKWLWRLADLASGAIWSLSLPPFNIWPLFWIGGLYLLWRARQAPTVKAAFSRGWWWGLGLNWAGFYWISTTLETLGNLPLWLGVIINQLYNSFFALEYALLAAGIFFIWRRFDKAWQLVVATSVLWGGLDIFFPQHLPWDATLVLSRWPSWQSTLEIWGTPGLAFWLYASLASFGLVLSRRVSKAQLVAVVLPLLAGLAFIAGFGFFTAQRGQDGPTVRVAAIQANISSGDKQLAFRGGNPDKQQAIVDRYLDLSREAAGAGAELILWPETAVPLYINQPSPLKQQIIATSRELGVDFLIGAYALENDNRYNGLFLLEHRSGNFTERYLKSVRLAGGEYIPGASLFPALKRAFPDIPDLAAGNGPQLITWRGLKLGPSICYEAILAGFTSSQADLGPQVLLNVTNDSFFGNTREPHFHLAAQRLISRQYGRPLWRAANTGISAFIDTNGREVARLGYDRAGILVIDAPIGTKEPTFYARYGYEAIRLLVAAGLIWLGISLFRRRI